MSKKRRNKKICVILVLIILLYLLFKYKKIIIITFSECYQALNANLGDFLTKSIIICAGSLISILVCWLIGKYEDKKLVHVEDSFSNRHPRLNMVIALALVIIMGTTCLVVAYYVLGSLGRGINMFVNWVTDMASKMEAVVIVAFITGMVSIIGVIISSVVAKIIDYRKSRQDYLARKREAPYGEFVEMIYKIQQNAKNKGSYTEEQMLEDLSKFSKQITLWGSSKVVNKWVKFRENGANPNAGINNLFLMEEIMNEMRKDLGLRRVKKGNLLAFFVNDIKEVLKTKK